MNKEELKELAATLNGIADGKAWEYLSTGDGDDFWTDPGSLDIGFCLFNCSGVRLKPWSLPPPPEGMQWHRDDWTEEMLDGGWRPLLRGEPRVLGDEFLFDQYERSSEWIDCNGPPATPNNPDSAWCHHRTKRPLPQPDPAAELKAAHAAGKKLQCKMKLSDAWLDFPGDFSNLDSRYEVRIKPEQQKVPLGSSDVPPGTVLRGAGEAATPEHQGWCMITSSSLTGIRIWRHSDSSQTEIKWETLMDAGSEIWRPTDTEWQPCYKLIDTP